MSKQRARINLYLKKDVHDALERLEKITGLSRGEIIRKSIKLMDYKCKGGTIEIGGDDDKDEKTNVLLL